MENKDGLLGIKPQRFRSLIDDKTIIIKHLHLVMIYSNEL